MIPFIRYRKVWYTLSAILMLLSVIGLIVRGVPLGIDFTGGSILEVSYTQDLPDQQQVQDVLKAQGISSASIQKAGEQGYVIRMQEISDEQHSALLAALRQQIGQTSPGITVQPSQGNVLDPNGVNISINPSDDGEEGNTLVEQRFDSVGPVIGQELKLRSTQALILVLLAIMAYVAWAFRRVSWPVKSWKYGVAAVLALFHDVIITFGAFIWIAPMVGWEVDTVFIAALLTVLGYSVNDTIVVFDRVRENLPRMDQPFEDVVNASVNQTMGRSINTTLTTLLVLVVIFFLGGQTLRPFMFTLTVGIFLGAYSSIFIASPLLVTWHQRSSRK